MEHIKNIILFIQIQIASLIEKSFEDYLHITLFAIASVMYLGSLLFFPMPIMFLGTAIYLFYLSILCKQ